MDLLFWGSLLFGGSVFVWAIIRDDGGLRASRRRELEKRLTRYPDSAGAVIVRGHPSSRWKLGGVIVLVVALAFLQPYLLGPGLTRLCQQLGLAESARWLLFALFPGLPVLVGLPLGFIAIESVRILRGGYAPPLDSRPAFDTIAVAGWRAISRGLVGALAAPAALALVAWNAYELRESFAASQRLIQPDAQCPARFMDGKGFRP